MGDSDWAQRGLEWTLPSAGLPREMARPVGLISAGGKRKGQAVCWASVMKGVSIGRNLKFRLQS